MILIQRGLKESKSLPQGRPLAGIFFPSENGTLTAATCQFNAFKAKKYDTFV